LQRVPEIVGWVDRKPSEGFSRPEAQDQKLRMSLWAAFEASNGVFQPRR